MYFVTNISEKLNLCEDQVYVNLPLPVKLRHWFYVLKTWFWKFLKTGKRFNIYLAKSSDFRNVPPFSRINLSHILWVLYQSGTYLILKGNFLTACLHIFLVFRWSETNLSIFGFFIIAPILIFEDLQLSELYSLSTILQKLKQKKVKKAVQFRPKIKTILSQKKPAWIVIKITAIL